MGVSDILEIARQGMAANRQGLETTANNIANAHSPGYSRQRVSMQSAGQNQLGNLVVGGGVNVKGVFRIHDAFVQKQIFDESKQLGQFRARSEELRRVEDLVHQGEGDLSGRIKKFFSDVREMSVSPEGHTTRNLVVHSAETVASGFRDLRAGLFEASVGIDKQVVSTLEDINSDARELASLNSSIARHLAVGGSPNELLDRRDMVLKSLSEKIGYQMVTDEKGHMNLVAPGVGMFVQGDQYSQFVAHRTAEREGKSAGSLDIFMKSGIGGEELATRSITDGKLGGLLHVRDKVIDPALSHLDQVAYEFGTRVNQVHRKGVGSDGMGERDLFKMGDSVDRAAEFISLDEKVKANPSAIAVGLGSDPGDNRIALEISEIENVKALKDPQLPTTGNSFDQTVGESLNALTGNVAIESQSVNQLFQNQEGILEQLNRYRENVSGVSLDEEAVNLMQYQTAFQASAKALRTGEEMLDTIMSLKD